MFTLALDTSSKFGGVAVLKDGSLMGEVMVASHETYSRRLLGTAGRLFKDLAIEWLDINLVGVSIGPGSFTGLRIGLSTAKGLAFSLRVPIIGVPTLDALAANITGCEGDLICPVIDARKGQVYTAFYRGHDDGGAERISPFYVIDPKDAVRSIPPGGRVFLLGEGARLLETSRSEASDRRIHFTPEHLANVRAASIGLIAEHRFKSGRTDDINALKPLYIRPSEAELNKTVMRRDLF